MRHFFYIMVGWIGVSLFAAAGETGAPQKFLLPPTTNALYATNPTTTPAVATTNLPLGTSLTGGAGYVIDDKHKLQPGDRINFRVLEDREPANTPPRMLTVTDSGDLDVPYLGLISVSGKTCNQLALEFKVLLEKDYYYHATVVIGLDSVSKVLGRVYLVGQVRNQGPVEIPAGEIFTASKAILRAGGFGEFAKKTAVKVIRTSAAGKQTFELNMEDILEKGKTEKDISLAPDDLIMVPPRLINF